MKNFDGTLNGIWWILCTGCMWNQLPEKYGKWNSVWRCFDRWTKSGLWDSVLRDLSESNEELAQILIVDGSHVKAHQDSTRSPLTPEEQKLGKTKGGRNTKVSACVNGKGKATSLVLVCGNEHDSKSFKATLPINVKAKYILADKAYDTNDIRSCIEDLGAVAVIPPKKNRIEPIKYNRYIGKLRRLVENFFARIKRFRRVGTRFEQKPENYTAFVTLAAIADWST